MYITQRKRISQIFLSKVRNKKKEGNQFFKKHFKPIYDTYKKNTNAFESKLKWVEQNSKWLNQCTLLCANTKVIHGCKEVACIITFQDKKGNRYTNSTRYDFDAPHGVFAHTDCWKYVKQEYGISLNYSHLPIDVFDIVDKKIFRFVLHTSTSMF